MADEDADGTDGTAAMTDPVRAHWEDVLSDTAATAAEFEERGWEALTLRPGDVTALAGEDVDRPGFDVLLPDDEFEDLLATVEDATFDAYDVYATVAEGTAFLLVVMQDAERETAVLFPVYYRRDGDSVEELREHAEETGTVRTLLRRLRRDRVVTFEHDDPELFFPDGE